MAQCPFFYSATIRNACIEDGCLAWVDQTYDSPVALKLKDSTVVDLDTIEGINNAYNYIINEPTPIPVSRLVFNSIIERIKSFEGYVGNEGYDDNSLCLQNFSDYYSNSQGYCSLIESAKLSLVSPMTILKGTTKVIIEESSNIQNTLDIESDEIQTTLSTESDEIQTKLDTESNEIQTKLDIESKEIRMRLVGLTGKEPYDSEDDYNVRSTMSILPVLKYVRHIHNDHYHSVPHLVDEGLSNEQENLDDNHIKPIRNGCVFSPIIAPPNVLLQEFLTNLDLDGNNMVYGKHFMIPNSDKNKPYILQTIEKMPEWSIPHPLRTMTYMQYLNSVGWHANPSWYYDNDYEEDETWP
jgi:hypothetical protein